MTRRAVTQPAYSSTELPSEGQRAPGWPRASVSPATSSATLGLHASPQTPSAGTQALGWAGSAGPSSVNLRYLENSPILVRGPATGRQYEFSGARPLQSVEARDAEALLRTRFFRRHY